MSRNWRAQALGSFAAIAVLVPLVVAAVRSEGYRETKVNLNDAGIWVVNANEGKVGRVNTQIATIEVSRAVQAASGTFDIAQFEASVAVFQPERVETIDVATVNPSGSLEAPEQVRVAIGGPTAAVVDEGGGSLWVRNFADAMSTELDDEEPIALGAGAAVEVDARGIVHTYAPRAGEIHSFEVGREAGVESVGEPMAAPQLTTVGSDVVLLDTEASRLRLPGGERVDLVDHGAEPVLQLPGPARDQVVVATDEALLGVDLDGGDITVLAETGNGLPVRPVALGACSYGAWAGAPVVTAQICPGRAPIHHQVESGALTAGELRFRVNRDRVVLNDLATGGVLLFTEEEPTEITDWAESDPEADEEQLPSDEPRQEEQECTERPTAPEPVELETATRPGRPVIVPVLDSVVQAGGSFDPCDVPIVEVPDPPDEATATVDIIADGTALQVTPTGDVGRVEVGYTLQSADPGIGPESSVLTVEVVADGNRPTETREDETSVVAGKVVRHDVLANDVSPDGDSLTLVGMRNVGTTAPASVSWRADGQVTVRAGEPGDVVLEYDVRDEGSGPDEEPVTGQLTVTVQPAEGNLPPVARADRVALPTGTTREVAVLDNDSDPEEAELSLSEVRALGSSEGLSFEADPDTGSIRVTAEEAGTWRLTYVVTDGEEQSQGRVRIQADDDEEVSHAPVAVRDDLVARPGVPAVVDLVANDLDRDDDVLGVTSLEIVDDGGRVAVEVVDHHIARVTAAPGFADAVVVIYEVSDGAASDEGVLVVRPYRDMGVDQPPAALDDQVTVRAGNVTRIPVLDNDSDPEGERLTLVNPEAPADEPTRGTDAPLAEEEASDSGRDPFGLDEDGSQGRLHVYGDELRFEAPDEVPAGGGTIHATYTVEDAGGQANQADVTIVITPGDAEGSPPRPRLIEARAVEGVATTIGVPLIGMDPDGDVVALRGVDPAGLPRKGHVEQVAEGFRYTADAGATGSDRFRFVVLDSTGEVALGSVSLVILPRSSRNSPPVAVLDRVSVKVGEDVEVPVLGNDRDPDGDPLRLLRGDPDDPDDPDAPSAPSGGQGSVAVESGRDVLVYDASGVDAGDEPVEVSFTYAVDDGRGGSARGLVVVTVMPDEPPNQPPLARDDFVVPVTPGEEVEVDVLGNDIDPDGPLEELVVTVPEGTEAVVRGGVISLQPETSTVVRYQLTDREGEGRSAWAYLVVPVVDDGRPTCGVTEVEVEAGREISVPVLDQCDENGGGGLRLVDVPTARGGRARLDGDEVVFTAGDSPTGDAGFGFVVSNGELEAVGGVRVHITGRNFAPELTSTDVQLPAGGRREVRLGELVTDRNAEDEGTHTFTLDEGATSKVQAEVRDDVLVVSATHDAKGEQTQLRITVSDGDEQGSGVVSVTVLEHDAPPPVAVDDAGETNEDVPVPIPVVRNDVDPIGEGLEIAQAGIGLPRDAGRAIPEGQSIRFEPASGFHGTAVFSYEVRDEADRTSQATVRVRVIGKPDRPAAPTNATFQQSGLVSLRWEPPASNGAPITHYLVEREGSGTVGQSSRPAYEDRSVENGTSYRYRVTAVNQAGEGEPSPWSERMTPDAVPPALAAPQLAFVPTGNAIDVSWQPPRYEGSPIQEYEVRISGGFQSSSPVSLPSGRTQHRWDGLENGTTYTFSVRARNAADQDGGWGPWSPTSSESPAAPPVAVQNVALQRLDEDTTVGGALLVEWSPLVGATQVNADRLDGYVVEWGRSAGVTQGPPIMEGRAELPAGQTAYRAYNLSNGQDYVFTVRGVNKAGEGAPGYSNPENPAARPAPVGSVSAIPGPETAGGTAVLSFALPADNGEPIDQLQFSVDSGPWSPAPWSPGTSGQFTASGSGLTNGQPATLRVRACNVVGCGEPSPSSNEVVPYGAPGAPSVSASATGQTISWSWNPPSNTGGRSLVGYEYRVCSSSCGNWNPVGTSTRSYNGSYGYSATRRLEVRAVNDGEAGEKRGSSGSATATTAAPPNPTITIDWDWTAPVRNDICNDCRPVTITVTNFSPGTHTVVCRPTDPEFVDIQITVGSNGQGSTNSRNRCYWGLGVDAWVSIGAVNSNVLRR